MSVPCRHFARGYCERGDACGFLHDPGLQGSMPGGCGGAGMMGWGADSMKRSLPDNGSWNQPEKKYKPYKVVPCRHWAKGFCQMGDECGFAHDPANKGTDNSGFLKTKLCTFFAEMGSCHRGAGCTFAHGEEELGLPQPNGGPVAGGSYDISSNGSVAEAAVESSADLFSAEMKALFGETEEFADPEQPSAEEPAAEEPVAPRVVAPPQVKVRQVPPVKLTLGVIPPMHQQRQQAPQAHAGWGPSSAGGGHSVSSSSGSGGQVWKKTKLCTYYEKSGQCNRGSSCTFAHGEEELGTLQPGQPGADDAWKPENQWQFALPGQPDSHDAWQPEDEWAASSPSAAPRTVPPPAKAHQAVAGEGSSHSGSKLLHGEVSYFIPACLGTHRDILLLEASQDGRYRRLCCETPMGDSKVYPTQLECYVLLTWLAKDFAWVLLLPPLGFPAALLAIFLEIYSVRLAWQWGTWIERAPGVATICWLTGNAIWMASEFLWDDEDGEHWFPWQSVPLRTPDEKLKMAGVRMAAFFFVAGLACFLLLLLDLTQQGMPSNDNPQDEEHNGKTEELIWGFFPPGAYSELFMAPWLFKELFWTYEICTPAMVAAVAAAVLILDSYRRFRSPLCIVELVWVIANSIWIYGELRERSSSAIREISAGLLALGFVMAAVLSLKTCAQPDAGRQEDSNYEQPTTEESCLTLRSPGYSYTK
eukprot:TRINITY_DN9464_c0_g2_i2.p1 TRINITY_DN9464_c0_g2~~TRINITY_DN9464_c0_g2_i2.p1  ORF type:complete len:728 (-),score=117.71 TRINITY_DN9464_c0_g2_i2:50-2152(-)